MAKTGAIAKLTAMAKERQYAGGGIAKLAQSGAMDKLAKLLRGTQETLPAAEREANKAKFLAESKTPMRLYHGTTATEGKKGQEAIKRIKPSKEGSLGSGVYLTPRPAQASNYTGVPNEEGLAIMAANKYHQGLAEKLSDDISKGVMHEGQEGGNMLPVYAQIKNPLVIEGKGDPMIEALIKLGIDEDAAVRMVERAYENKGYIGKEVETRARAAGYDGLMQYRDGDLSEVVSYNPNAVKSAIGNRGTYDTNKPDLNEAAGGAVHMQAGGFARLLNAGKGAKKTPPAAETKIIQAPTVIVPSKLSNVKEAVRQSKGDYGARRVERAADEIPNLERMYKEEGLRRAFAGDDTQAVMTMNPADFEKYARRLSERTRADIGPKMAELARKGEIDKYTVPTDEFIKHLQRLRDGFDDVPYLNLFKDEVGIPVKPTITGHEGRHRSRALADKGEKFSLVRINPRGDLQEGMSRSNQEQYIQALRDELDLTGNLVMPEGGVGSAVVLPDIYAEGGEVRMKKGGEPVDPRFRTAGGDPLDEFVPPRYRRAGRRPESQQDREAAANIPVAVARGLVSGSLGLPADLLNLPGAIYSGITGKESYELPFGSEYIEKRLPFRGASQTPVGEMFTGAGQLAGGFYTGPGSGARAVMAVPRALRQAGQDFVVAAGNPAVSMASRKGITPIVVRTPEERAVVEKFGQKQEQEAVRAKKVEKLAKSDEPKREVKSKGRREKVQADIYRKMADDQGDAAVLRAASAGEHLKPTSTGYVGAPRTVTSPQALGAMRRAMDKDFADSVEAVRLADPDRLGTWYDRAKRGIAESSEPYQLPRTLEQHGVYSAGVSPESELTFALKHLDSRVAGDPQMAYRGAGMRNLDTAVAENRPANMGFKIGEYANKNDPRIPNEGLFGVNDFRRAQGMGYTDPAGNPWKAGVSETMHPFMDAETALQVDRANRGAIGGRTDWAGPHIQEVPWVYGKAQDLYGRGKKGRYAGDELEGIKMSLQDANNTARDYFYKHAASATHEAIPGASLGHVRQALDMTPEQKLAYGREGRWDMPPPEYALSDMGEVGAGNRDIIYGALGYRQLPSREASGLYRNKLGEVETNPMTIARPLMDFPTGGGGGRMAEDSSRMMDTSEQFRALLDAQEAGAYNLPNTMASVKGKNAMVLDTRGQVADPLADPSAGVLPSADQLGQITNALNEASDKAAKSAKKVREDMPYGPPTKAVANKLANLDDAAGGYGVTATNRGALIFPYNSESGGGGLNEIMKIAGRQIDAALPGAQREKAIASTGYVPGVGKRSPEGPLSTAPYSGEATSDMLRAFSELPQSVALNLSESEAVREAIRAKALRDSKMGGTRGDIQETRRFFSEADWPRAVEMIRRGMTPAAALAALGYSASSMAQESP
jgi:hypothetical protein